jgi:galactose mutarotase-like enzyme
MDEGGTIAAKEENVLIRAGDCTVTLLPEFGGKISSIRVKGHELLQKPLAPVAARTRTMSFDAGDASGWDECLPSVGACSVETADGTATIPDHGDLWRVKWTQRDSAGNSSVTLRGECFSLPLTLERSIEVATTKQGWRLSLEYTLTNTGRSAMPWSWAAHSLFAVEPGDSLELPASIRELRVEGSGGQRLGKTGDRVAWPLSQDRGDLSKVLDRTSQVGDKLFAGPLSSTENWCVIHRPSAGIDIRMTFDSAATPFLGVWLCYGGWPDRPGAKQMCVAPEPCTAPVDSLAQSGGWSRVLAPGESCSWPVLVDLEVKQGFQHA